MNEYLAKRGLDRRKKERGTTIANYLTTSPITQNKRTSLIDRRKECLTLNGNDQRKLSKRIKGRRREDLADLESNFLPVSICGTGFYVPEQIITNEDYERKYGVSSEWIKKVSGIETRRKASPSEDCATLGAKAAKRALEKANIPAHEIDLVILSSTSPNFQAPPTSCIIQNLIGAYNAATMDINVACMGYIWALNIGAALINVSTFRNALIIASEVALQGADYEDKDSYILLGDGAGACILKKSIEQKKGILSSYFRTEGNKWDLATILFGVKNSKEYLSSPMNKAHLFHMKGKDIYRFAVSVIPDAVKKTAKRAKIDQNDIALIIPHQANLRILESAMNKMKLPREKFLINVQKFGNTSSASIAIALADAEEQGRIKEGDIVVLVGFGSGLSWGSMAIKW